LPETDDEKKAARRRRPASRSCARLMKEILGDKVEKVVLTERLVQSPCVLVTGEFGWSAQIWSAS
jgi:molecular chaperone HtpG